MKLDPQPMWDGPSVPIPDGASTAVHGTLHVAGVPDWAHFERPSTRVLNYARWTGIRIASDAGAAVAALTAGLLVIDRSHPLNHLNDPHIGAGLAFPFLWIVVLAASAAYERRNFIPGLDEYARILSSAVWALAAVGVASYAFKAETSRSMVAVMLPVTTMVTLIGRRIIRRRLQGLIRGGAALQRVLVVGAPSDINDLVQHLAREDSGFEVCGTMALDTQKGQSEYPDIAADASIREVLLAAHQAHATTLAVSASAMPSRQLRQLSWAMEGRRIRLFVVPSMTDLAGPRIVVNVVDGLPILEVEEPQFRGVKRLAKGALDRTLAALLLLLAAAPLLIVAAMIRLADGGPALYRQARVGHHGREFTILKFRTMRVDADEHYARLVRDHGHTGLVFKLPKDPRITGLGRWLRRFSIDETPQLLNVLGGSMSLVGPRPQRASEVALYDELTRRRLLVKPGMTGLWQVSGRSDLTWEETVRLDLHYVDHWSVSRDIVLLLKTVGVVLRGRGAY